MDFKPILQKIIPYYEGGDYENAARYCVVAIEKALIHALKQNLSKLPQEERENVQNAIDKRDRYGKGVEGLMMKALDDVIRTSNFLDAWERVSGRNLKRVRWFALDQIRGFRNEFAHGFPDATQDEAELLIAYLRAILEGFELIDMDDAASMLALHQQAKPSAKSLSEQSFMHGHALIVGVGADLPPTINDAKGIADILMDSSRCAYPHHQVKVLTEHNATRSLILSALDTLAQTTTADSTVMIYFSGHGYQIGSTLGNAYYLMPFGYDIQSLFTTAISGTEFAERLQVIPAKKLLVLLDCCHAGGVGEAKIPGLNMVKQPVPPEVLPLLSEGSGRVLIASSREDEFSFAGKPYSAFTAAIIEALCGKSVAKKDGYVRVADLALYASEVVPGRTDGRQHPVLHFSEADNFVLAYYAGGDTQPKALPFTEEPEIESSPENRAASPTQQNVVSAGRDMNITGNGNITAGNISVGNGSVIGSGNTIHRN